MYLTPRNLPNTIENSIRSGFSSVGKTREEENTPGPEPQVPSTQSARRSLRKRPNNVQERNSNDSPPSSEMRPPGLPNRYPTIGEKGDRSAATSTERPKTQADYGTFNREMVAKRFADAERLRLAWEEAYKSNPSMGDNAASSELIDISNKYLEAARSYQRAYRDAKGALEEPIPERATLTDLSNSRTILNENIGLARGAEAPTCRSNRPELRIDTQTVSVGPKNTGKYREEWKRRAAELEKEIREIANAGTHLFEALPLRLNAFPEFQECSSQFRADIVSIEDKFDLHLKQSTPEFEQALFSGEVTRALLAINGKERDLLALIEEYKAAWNTPLKMAEPYIFNDAKWNREWRELAKKFDEIGGVAELRHSEISLFKRNAVGIKWEFPDFVKDVAPLQSSQFNSIIERTPQFERALFSKDLAQGQAAIENKVRQLQSILREYENALNEPLARAENYNRNVS